MPKTLKHDPADRATCSYCGIAEDIHLLDGVLDQNGDDTGKIACIACYPTSNSWCPTGAEHIAISIAPKLKAHYEAWERRELLKSYGYKLVTRDAFQMATDRPPGLLERAFQYHGAFVLYDPDDDAEGWLLVGDDPDALAAETIVNFEMHHAAAVEASR